MIVDQRYVGSSLDDLLAEDRTLGEASAVALKRVIAYEIRRTMEEQRISKTTMARRMQTSRAALNRLLDPNNTSVTLVTMDRAAAVLGKKLRLELVDAA